MRSTAMKGACRNWLGTVSGGAVLMLGGQAYGAEAKTSAIQLDELVVTAQHRTEA